MIIRLGMMDTDKRYLEKLSLYFETHRDATTHLEISLFTSLTEYRAFAENDRLDILLATIPTLESPSDIGDQVLVAYFTDDRSMTEYEGYPAICKYQKALAIFRAIQELASRIHGSRGAYSLGEAGRIVLFVGSAGGVGCTTAAIGFAARMARLGRKVIYLSYQQNAQAFLYFTQRGGSMSDVHYAYQEWLRNDNRGKEREDKDRKHRLQLKLISKVGTDPETGVSCYDSFSLPIDAREMDAAEISDQVEALATQFDECVVDMDGRIDASMLSVIRQCYWTIVVSDGTEKGNFCACRMLEGLKALNDSGEAELSREVGLLYTKFGSRAGEAPNLPGFVRMVGKIDRYKGAGPAEIVRDLSKSAAYGLLE